MIKETKLATSNIPHLPESSLPLLGPDFNKQNAETFYTYVISLFDYRRARKKEINLNGKILETATKKRNGKYEIEYRKTGQKCIFYFTKEAKQKVVAERIIKIIAGHLNCSSEKVIEFFTAKKFLPKIEFSSGQLIEVELSKMTTVKTRPAKKEDSNDHSSRDPSRNQTKDSKENARVQEGERTLRDSNQLLVVGSTSDVHEKGTILPS